MEPRYTMALMSARQPSALVIDRDADSRRRASALLRDAGFAVTGRARRRDGLAALARCGFDLAVIAGEPRDALAAARRVHDRRAATRFLVLAPTGTPPVPEDHEHIRVVPRPLDEWRFGAAMRELMAPASAEIAGREAAELGLIEAQLACLFNRHAAAERSGSTTVARDICHQIGDAVAARQYLLQSHGAS